MTIDEQRITAANTGFASGGVTSKLGALCFYSSVVQVDSFVLRNPPERKAPNRCAQAEKKQRHSKLTKKWNFVKNEIQHKLKTGFHSLTLRMNFLIFFT